MKFKKLGVLLLVLTLTLSLAACKDGENGEEDINGESEEEQIVEGGEINIPITNVIALNPLLNSSSSVFYFNKLVFEGLFAFDKNLEPKEQLVENYNINPDGSIDISLKKNILWHDGKSLKASDVKFTVDTIKYALSNNAYAGLVSDMFNPESILDINKIADVAVKDDANLTIYFTEEFNNILEMLTFPIIASHPFADDYERALETETYTPIGTGPYKQVEYEKLKSIKLGVNDQYWGEKPNIKTIKGKILKDEDLSLTSFESGQVDLAFSLESKWEKYAQDEKVKVNEFPSRRYEFLAINSNGGVFQSEAGASIRKAIAYAIDKDNIIDKVYLSHASKTNTPINPNSYLTNKEINEKYKHDDKKAREILEEAGFVDEDNDNMYEDEAGNPLTVKLTTNSYNDLRVKTLELISDDLKNIGITVEKDYEVLDTSMIDENAKQLEWDRFQSKVNSGAFEIALLGWDTSFKQDIAFMFEGGNFMNYQNPELDQIFEGIRNSRTKEDKKNNYINAQNIILEDLPYISLFFPNGAILSNKKINGDIGPNYINIYTDIDKWFIPEKYQAQTD